MRARLVILSLLGAASLTGLLGGCVYYNGMYNANRLARSARKAERDGRTFEANGLWGQVATKAESVLVRHPTSKYAGEAGLLRGVALARLGQCDQALGALSRLTIVNTQSDLTEDALLATGRCHVAVGNLAAGDAAFSQLLQSKNGDRRRDARFQHARVLRQMGQYDQALSALAGIHEPRASGERVLALAGAGRVAQAVALMDSLIAQGDTTKRWDSLVVVLAPENPSAASSLVDRIGRLPNRNRELQTRMLLEDGFRLAKIDANRAAKRFREVMSLDTTSEAAGRAGAGLVQLELARVHQPAELAPIVDTLNRLAARFKLASDEITRLGAFASEVHRVGVGVTPDTSQGDLRLFLVAESARDTLAAPRLAEALFRRIHEEWPSSPYAPKAILAAQQLNPGWVDSARALLEVQYFDSPYLARVRGEATPEYRQLEDSLGTFAALLAAMRPDRARRRPPPAVDPRRRPEPVSGGSRIPEPN